MQDRIYADLAILERGVENFEHVLREYEDVLTSLDAHLRVSLADWRGEARRAYQEFHPSGVSRRAVWPRGWRGCGR